MDSEIKVFQRRDGSLIFFVSAASDISRDNVNFINSCLKSVLKDGDRAIIAANCDFKFYNISDEQLNKMEIKSESASEPSQK